MKQNMHKKQLRKKQSYICLDIFNYDLQFKIENKAKKIVQEIQSSKKWFKYFEQS